MHNSKEATAVEKHTTSRAAHSPSPSRLAGPCPAPLFIQPSPPPEGRRVLARASDGHAADIAALDPRPLDHHRLGVRAELVGCGEDGEDGEDGEGDPAQPGKGHHGGEDAAGGEFGAE